MRGRRKQARFLAVSFFALLANHRYTLPVVFAILVAYGIVLLLGNGYVEDGSNIAARIDNVIFGYDHLYHKSAIDKKIESANIALEQKAGAYFNDLNEKITDSLKEYESAQQNIMDLLSEENHKRVDEFESMKNAQRQFLETTNSNFEQRNAKIEETASSFIKDQTELANQTQKRVKLYQAVSIIACVVSVASLIVAIFV